MKYEVYAHNGQLLMTADEEACWYDSETARAILEAGYVIKLDGKRVTKAALALESGAKRSEVVLKVLP